jgi:rhodanese-related sulfurtransferase/TusA-related sulfurtransferase
MRARHPATLAVAGHEETFVIDVRAADEFEIGAIPGAVNIPIEALRERLHEIPKDRPVLVTCQIGAKAHSAARLLGQRGFDAYTLIGGYRTWRLYHEPPATPTLLRQAPVELPSLSAVTEATELDTRGLSCPGPIMHVRKQMERLDAGALLRIRASDPSFPKDFQLWCKKTGHNIVEESGRPGDYMVVCRKH